MFSRVKGVASRTLIFILLGSWSLLLLSEGILSLLRAWYVFRMKKAVKVPYRFLSAIRKKMGFLVVLLNAGILVVYFLKNRAKKKAECY